MATYPAIDTSIPTGQRAVLIKDIHVSDKINIYSVLMRTARGFKLQTGSELDSISYRINNLKSPQTLPLPADEIWSQNSSVFTNTGDTEYVSVEGLELSSIEFTELILASGTTIEMVVW